MGEAPEDDGLEDPPIRGGRASRGGSNAGGTAGASTEGGGSSRGGSSRGGSSRGGTSGRGGGGTGGAEDPTGGIGGEPACGSGVPKGDRVIDTQADLSALVDVAVLEGDLEIHGAVNLSALSCLTSVGSLTISHNPSLTTLSGLEQLTEISGTLVIAENQALSSVEALDSVVSVWSDVSIENNPRLPTCQAENLVNAIGDTNIVGAVSIDGNDDVATCPDDPVCGGEYMVPTGRDSWIDSQEKLEALRGYTQITGTEWAIGEARDLSPLECLTRIDVDNAEIWYLDATDAHGLENLTEVTGAFGFGGFLESLRGLDSLESVGMELWFSGPRLRDLGGLESLVEVGGTLTLGIAELENVEALANVERLGGLHLLGTQVETLAGLENLVTIEGDSAYDFGHLALENNPSLRNLHALANLRHVSGDLIIEGNSGLPTCEAEWLVDSLTAKAGIDGIVSIAGTNNAPCIEP